MWRPERWIATLLTMPAIRSSALRCASVALAAILLTGCTSEAAPAPTAPATTAATPAVSPPPSPAVAAPSEPAIEKITTPPRVPADLTTPGKVGSKAAVEYFVALYGYTLNTGDTSLLRAVSTETCEYCLDLIGKIEKNTQEGLAVDGGGLDLRSVTLHEGKSTENRHYWYVDVTLMPTKRLAADGTISLRTESIDHTSVLLATWDGAAWHVAASHDVRSDDETD